MKIYDLAEMPDINEKAGKHGLNSVSSGLVYWTDHNKVTCRVHGAMNKMSPHGIWRCIMCNEGAYEKPYITDTVNIYSGSAAGHSGLSGYIKPREFGELLIPTKPNIPITKKSFFERFLKWMIYLNRN